MNNMIIIIGVAVSIILKIYDLSVRKSLVNELAKLKSYKRKLMLKFEVLMYLVLFVLSQITTQNTLLTSLDAQSMFTRSFIAFYALVVVSTAMILNKLIIKTVVINYLRIISLIIAIMSSLFFALNIISENIGIGFVTPLMIAPIAGTILLIILDSFVYSVHDVFIKRHFTCVGYYNFDGSFREVEADDVLKDEDAYYFIKHPATTLESSVITVIPSFNVISISMVEVKSSPKSVKKTT
ncbi:MAG: hypothetical protein Q8S24_00800 [Eubacteriales bacterium]|nr:hypothetical protein [Eubacteriales bacterium]